jgi:N-dimethylarginine dimethylaminohydrolase
VTPAARIGGGVLLGVAVSAAVALAVGNRAGAPAARLVPEDASGALRRIAIHYVPSLDERAMPVWRQLFAALPGDVEVAVAVPAAADFPRLIGGLRAAGVGHLERFRPVVVDQPLTTWSRDRMASLEASPGGAGSILAPPRVASASAARTGDWAAPFAIAREVYHATPRISEMVFEGGDLAASAHHVFADANLMGRNLGRRDATRAHLEAALRHTFNQDVVWLGDDVGEVPEHHIMMYMVPLDDDAVLVGDVRRGVALAGGAVPSDPDVDGMAARFDRVAELLAARGFRVSRIPVVVLPGKGSYVTYTNALFDRDGGGKVVYLPTYRVAALDEEARRIYEGLGYRVVPIDVSTIYTLNGSLGCLVNVMGRG